MRNDSRLSFLAPSAVPATRSAAPATRSAVPSTGSRLPVTGSAVAAIVKAVLTAAPTAALTAALTPIALVLSSATPVAAQPLLSAGEVMAMEAPAPSLRIAYGADPLQFGHLRLPSGDGPFPVIVFVHGGCWLSAYDIGHVGLLEQA